ncbi:alkaline phosphatase [candidate division GN15 bacterium]|nr:alkaline phosphatase [candidate division GN15 bacterium]
MGRQIISRTLTSFLLLCAVLIPGFAAPAHAQSDPPIDTGSVVFIHPDGTGGSMWQAHRVYRYGPDSVCHWDRMERMGLYRSHVLNSTNSSSHGGATIHAYGIKVPFDTYGNASLMRFKSLSGKDHGILIEAQKAGMATALINSGHICEPGTGVFAASAPQRSMTDLIAERIINSNVDIIFAGGERYLLPEGEMGRHGEPGVRNDDKNLIEQARANGYAVIFTREELLQLPSDVDRVLGVFAARHTFHAAPEEELAERGLPHYEPEAPTVAEMTAVALRILDTKGKRFIMVVEEEGTDNFGNSNNAAGTLEALKRADDAIGVVIDYIDRKPNTLLITAADSEAGGFQIRAIRNHENYHDPLPATSDNGAPVDGIAGPGTEPFVAAPDKNGVELRFAVAWSCYDDVAGSVLARAHGLNAHLLGTDVDNTDIYRIMYATLFGKLLPAY